MTKIGGVRVFVGLAVLAAGIGEAQAHDWYSGLKEPGGSGRSCCGGHDCEPVDLCVQGDGREGLLLGGTCQPIRWDKVLPMPSPDGEAHVCIVGGEQRCVWLPGAS